MRNLICLSFITLFCFFVSPAAAQDLTIKGVVKDRLNDRPLTGVAIFVEGTNAGTITDGKGRYTLLVPEGATKVTYALPEYQTQQVLLEPGSAAEIIQNISLSENLIGLPELVVESFSLANGYEGLKETPGSYYFISPKELSKFGHTNVNAVLQSIPGVNIQEEEGFGLRPNIGMRGTSIERSSKITVMEDGILTAPAPYTAPAAYYFPTIGRMNAVEVLKGASQIKFGPFTTGGAINFVSTPIPGDFSGKVNVMGGNFGTRNIHAHVGESGEQLGFLIETFQMRADGFKTLPGGQDTGFDKQDYQFKFRANTKKDANIYQELLFKAGQTTELSNETYLGLSDGDFAVDPYQRYAASQRDQMNSEQQRFSLQHYAELPGFNIATTAYRNTFSRNWYKLNDVVNAAGEETSLSNILETPAGFAEEMSILRGTLDTDYSSLILRANRRDYTAQGIQTVLDFEYEGDRASHDLHFSVRYHEDDMDRFQNEDGYAIQGGTLELLETGAPGSNSNRLESAQAWASYLSYKLEFDRWILSPGLRYENINLSRLDYGTSDPDRTGGDLSERSNRVAVVLPGAGATFKARNDLYIFAGVNKGFSPPGSREGTDSEESWNYELGLRKFGDGLVGTATLFYIDYNNLLGTDLAAGGGAGTNELFNAGTAITRGLEMQLIYDLIQGSSSRFSLPVQLNYTYTDAQFTQAFESEFDGWAGNITAGDEIPYIASHQLFASAGLQHHRFDFTITGRYQSQVRTAPGQGEVPAGQLIPDFWIMNTALNVEVSKYATLAFTVNNLLDNAYAVARRPAGLRPGMPRSFTIGMRARF